MHTKLINSPADGGVKDEKGISRPQCHRDAIGVKFGGLGLQFVLPFGGSKFPLCADRVRLHPDRGTDAMDFELQGDGGAVKLSLIHI